MAKGPKKALVGKLRIPQLAASSVPESALLARKLAPMPAGTFAVRWAKFDFHGQWCLGNSDSSAIVELMNRIKSLESMRPIDIFGTTKSYVGTDYDLPAKLIKPAMDRLAELGFADETRISRLQIAGAPRLYGFRRDPEFYAIFWDPKHEIYPSPLKHT